MMRRTIVLLICILAAARADAHVVQQIFTELKVTEDGWNLEVLFDAGYSKPEWRDDRDSPQPLREWLVAKTPEEQLDLCKEAATYLDQFLEFTTPEGHVETEAQFTDLEQTPPDFPELLNGGAYFRILIEPKSPPQGTTLTCHLKEGAGPNFIVKIVQDRNERPHYLTVQPGESVVLLNKATHPGQSTATLSASGLPLHLHSLSEGFLHVLPGGIDHILFIIAIFFLCRQWKPLIWQSLAFTAAHTLTLGLTAAGIIAPRANLVEPLIALSIAALAIENLLRDRFSAWRAAHIFGFGLIHGMGFATALSSLLTPGEGFVGRLLMANLGVELAQISILAFTWLVTVRLVKTPHFESLRKAVNIILTTLALVWFLERVASIV